jgi:glycosyltransferase involved in cell wall biosynthesis
MRVLYYNWADYLDPEGRGGGVTLYQRNLIEGLADRPDIQADFLSAGIAHDLRGRAPRWELAPGKPPRYEIVNSGLPAPSHHAFAHPAEIEHAETEAVFEDFVARNGPYDILHFQNLEGLPARVLAQKQRWPKTRVILTLHNYYPFCPQVNLWRRESTHCTDFQNGRACVECLPRRIDPRLPRAMNAAAYRLRSIGIRPGTALFAALYRPGIWAARRAVRLARMLRGGSSAERADAEAASDAAARFARRRKDMVGLINAHCDRVLCVSHRVTELAASYGIDRRLIRTVYIGTDEAKKFVQTSPRPAFLKPDGTLTLAFLGYMRRDKGFYFLLDAIEALPDAMARRLRLVIAARRGDTAVTARLDALRQRLASLQHYDGYKRSALDSLLADVDLGVVPVLWEDNLPQVAIEMHARHIPLLTSDRGGARELGNCPALVFRAGDTVDFAERLGAVLDGRVTPAQYWATAMPPVGMADHLAELMQIYAETASRDADSRARTKGASDQGTDSALS